MQKFKINQILFLSKSKDTKSKKKCKYPKKNNKDSNEEKNRTNKKTKNNNIMVLNKNENLENVYLDKIILMKN